MKAAIQPKLRRTRNSANFAAFRGIYPGMPGAVGEHPILRQWPSRGGRKEDSR